MKIFTYTGSRRPQSNTNKLINRIIQYIEKNEEIEVNRYTAHSTDIKACIGCCKCFSEGKCSLDSVDRFDIIKEQMLEADMIILGTPVYSAMVSGDMKIFIDRLSNFLHIMPLCAKPVILVITASGNSLIETNTFFKKIVESWGGFVPFSILCSVDVPNMLVSEEFNNIVFPKYCREIFKLLHKPDIKSSTYQETYFSSLKSAMVVPSDNAEYRYWKDNDMLGKKTYQELIDSKQKNR